MKDKVRIFQIMGVILVGFFSICLVSMDTPSCTEEAFMRNEALSRMELVENFGEISDETYVEEEGKAPASYVVEVIEEASFSGGASGRVYRDSASVGWMCNNGSPETPADFIVETYVSGSYTNLSYLKVRGTNPWAWCYLSEHPARVFDNDRIRMCIGYWTVQGCLAYAPIASEIKTRVLR